MSFMPTRILPALSSSALRSNRVEDEDNLLAVVVVDRGAGRGQDAGALGVPIRGVDDDRVGDVVLQNLATVYDIDLVIGQLLVATSLAHEGAVDVAAHAGDEVNALQLLGIGLQCAAEHLDLHEVHEHVRSQALDVVRPGPHALAATEALLLRVLVCAGETLCSLLEVLRLLGRVVLTGCQLVVVRSIPQVGGAEHHRNVADVVVRCEVNLLAASGTAGVAETLDGGVLHDGVRGETEIEGVLLGESLEGIVPELPLAVHLVDGELLDPLGEVGLGDHVERGAVPAVQCTDLCLCRRPFLALELATGDLL